MSKVLMPDFEEFCSRLHGDFGEIFDDEIVDCPRCSGYGFVSAKAYSTLTKECEDCGGSGEYVQKRLVPFETIRRIYHRAITNMGESVK